MDRSVLREALAALESALPQDAYERAFADALLMVAAAARAVVEAPEVWWCEEHRTSGVRQPRCTLAEAGLLTEAALGQRMAGKLPCRMAVVYLVPQEQK